MRIFDRTEWEQKKLRLANLEVKVQELEVKTVELDDRVKGVETGRP